MSVSYDTARARTAPRRSLPALPSDPAGLLAAAHKANDERRARAFAECDNYQLRPGAVLLKKGTTTEYKPLRFAVRIGCPIPWHQGCDCADYKRHVLPLLDAMEAVGVATSVRCKHGHIRDILSTVATTCPAPLASTVSVIAA